MSAAERLAAILTRRDEAARRAGRDPGSVTLVAVGKTFPPERVQEMIDAGALDIGENYVQELLAKIEQVRGARWHFIGHLQSNKARKLVGKVHLIHSVDSKSLAEELSRRSLALGVVTPILIEVNLGGEQTKSGVNPGELLPLLREIGPLPGVSVQGLMTLPPPAPTAEQARPFFRQLRELAGEVRAEGLPGVEMKELSMGMSSDFEVAIEEGATIIRVGTALFGAR